MWLEKLPRAERRKLMSWAKRSLHGLTESEIFVGILDDHPMDEGRMEFTLQLGHAVLLGKLIVIPVPYDVEVPRKLLAVADRIVRYRKGEPESLYGPLTEALTELGINKQ